MSDSSYTIVDQKMILVEVSGCQKLNVRVAPDMNSKVIEVLNAGTLLEKVDSFREGEFSRVRLLNGKNGYAMTRYLREV